MKSMKWFSLILITALGFSACDGKKEKESGKTNTANTSEYAAPDFSGVDILTEKTYTLSELKGKVVLLNFWATWCGPCQMEIPDLVILQEKYKDKFMIIGVSVDRVGMDEVKQFAQNMKINYPVLMGAGALTDLYGGISAIPTSFVVNKKGELVNKIVGYRNLEGFEAVISKYIQE